MRKTFNFFAAAALVAFAAVACQKEQLSDSSAEGTESVTFTVQTEVGTKAVADEDGLAAKIDQVLVAVYMKDGDTFRLYDEPVATYTASNKQATFSVNLIRKQTYQIVVWAQKEGAYVCTGGLQSIVRSSAKASACNDDELDAFYASHEYIQGSATASTSIYAKRPFAQLNLITKDLRTGFEPSNVTVTYVSDTKFNALTGLSSEPAATAVTYSATQPNYKAQCKTLDAAKNTLVMNYLFAPETEQLILPSVKMTAQLTEEVDFEVSNVPVKRNYRTNVIGNLLTEQTNYTITVVPTWEGETEVSIPTTYAAAQAAVADPKIQTVVVTQEVVDDYLAKVESGAINPGSQTLPDGSTKKLIEFKLTQTSPTDLKQFELPAAPDGYAWHITHEDGYPTQNVDVVAPAASSVIIDAPNSHVTLNGQNYSAVIASTSGTTLVVPEGIVIDKLEILKGGLEIHGTVNVLKIAEDADVVIRDCEGLSQTVYDVAKNFLAPGYVGTQTTDGKWNIALSDYWIERVVVEPDGFVKDDASKTIRISTPEGLAWLSRNTQTNNKYFAGYTVLLNDDIDLGAAYWTPIKMWSPENKTSFDGQGHTISNLKLKGSSTNDLSLFGSCAMNIKNFILDGVTITGANGYTGAVVGHLYGDLEKITVKNANITGSYWGIGGIVGFHNSGNMTDCHVIDSQINGGCPGGLTGVYNETDGRVYSNCSAENVILHDTSCWGAPYLYGSIIAVVNNTIEFVSCSSSNMTYKYEKYDLTYHSGEEGSSEYAPAHRLFGDASELEIIIDGETFVQQ